MAQQEVKTQPADTRGLNADEESCKAFVQKFYDWYWNRFPDPVTEQSDVRSMPGIEDVEQRRPAVLSQELVRLIERDSKDAAAEQAAPNMDFDPFVGGNGGATGKYNVLNVAVRQDRCLAVLSNSRHRVTPELKKTGTSWTFVNFHYSFYSEDGKTKEFPDDDLIQILSR